MDCGGPPELRNGRISDTSSMTTTYNSTVKYECDDGFEFDGAIDMSRTCLASGNWSNGEFMCSEFLYTKHIYMEVMVHPGQCIVIC